MNVETMLCASWLINFKSRYLKTKLGGWNYFTKLNITGMIECKNQSIIYLHHSFKALHYRWKISNFDLEKTLEICTPCDCWHTFSKYLIIQKASLSFFIISCSQFSTVKTLVDSTLIIRWEWFSNENSEDEKFCCVCSTGLPRLFFPRGR